MASPYELLAGLALLREKKREKHRAGTQDEQELQEWSGFWVQVGELVCLIPCDHVDEVVTPSAVARVRGVPVWVRGVAYFRTQLVTVVDAACFLLGRTQVSPGVRVFVMRGQREWFGLQVDAFEGVRHVWSDTQQTSTPAHFTGAWLRYVKQWLSMEGQSVAVLDVPLLMAALENQPSLLADGMPGKLS